MPFIVNQSVEIVAGQSVFVWDADDEDSSPAGNSSTPTAGEPGVSQTISFVLIQKPFLPSLPLPPLPSELHLQLSQPCLCSISMLPVPMTWRRQHPFLPHRRRPLIFQDQLL